MKKNEAFHTECSDQHSPFSMPIKKNSKSSCRTKSVMYSNKKTANNSTNDVYLFIINNYVF